jgi:hypothetical protein
MLYYNYRCEIFSVYSHIYVCCIIIIDVIYSVFIHICMLYYNYRCDIYNTTYIYMWINTEYITSIIIIQHTYVNKHWIYRCDIFSVYSHLYVCCIIIIDVIYSVFIHICMLYYKNQNLLYFIVCLMNLMKHIELFWYISLKWKAWINLV